MNSPDTHALWEESISARLDGELAPLEEVQLDQHLASCAACRDLAARMDRLHRTVRVRPADDDVPDLADEILAAAPVRHARRRGPALVAATAVVLALAGGLGIRSLIAGSEPAPAIAQIDGVATTAQRGSSGAIYLALVNDGGGDHLTSASTTGATRTVLHTTEQRDGLTIMAKEEERPIAAQGTTVLGPGGSHVMLNGLTVALEPGDLVEVTLVFERSGPRTISVPVVAHTDLPDEYWATNA